MRNLFPRLTLITLLTGLVLPALAQQPFIILKDGRRIAVQRLVTKPQTGALVVYIQDRAPTEVKREGYVRALGVKPPEIDQAIALIAQKENKQAIDLLRAAMTKSKLQSWDVKAGTVLADLLIEGGNARGADAVLNTLKKDYGSSLLDTFPELQLVEWKVRIAGGKVSGLQEELTEILMDKESSRSEKAMAQLVRGDLKRRREEFKSAALDYMRTAYFYPEEAEIHAEALYKSAAIFAEMGDAVRSRKFANELKERHPGSTFVGKPIGN